MNGDSLCTEPTLIKVLSYKCPLQINKAQYVVTSLLIDWRKYGRWIVFIWETFHLAKFSGLFQWTFLFYSERERASHFLWQTCHLIGSWKTSGEARKPEKKVVVVSVICDCNGKSEVPRSPFVFSGNFQFAVSVDWTRSSVRYCLIMRPWIQKTTEFMSAL